MKTKTSKLMVGLMITLLAAVMIFFMVNVVAASPSVKTDWPSYVPGETATISGSGFAPNDAITVTIEWPSGSRTDTVTPAPVTDSAGDFTCTYTLPDVSEHGTYTVVATDSSGASATTTFTGTEDFYGYNRDSITDPVPGSWTKGNLGQNYVEGDFVSYQLYLDNASKAWGNNFTISYNFHQDNTNAIYIDGFDTSTATGFQYTGSSSLLADGVPIPPSLWGTHIPTPAAGESAAPETPQIVGYMDPWPPGTSEPLNPTGDTVADERAFNVTNLPWDTFTNGYVILFFRAHLALDIIWGKGLEPSLPQVLDGNVFHGWTNMFHGASFATGSSRHFYLQYPGIGQKDIPIPIASYPSTLINGYKYVNGIPFNGWNITLNGNLSLGGGQFIPYNPPAVQTGTGTFINGTTWPTGYFEFTGLITGVYQVTEENRAGYVHYDVVANGTGIDLVTNIPAGWAKFNLTGGDTETIRFYNIFGIPNISLTKTPSATKVENNTSVTYTYNATNIGTIDLINANLTDSVYGTIFTNQAIAVNQSIITTITRTLTANVTNIANVTATDSLNRFVNATATAFVQVIHPSISLTKTADSKVENNTSVTYTYTVTNTGDTPLTVSLADNQIGTIWSGKVMAAGASNVTTVSRVLTSTTTNIATATGVDQNGTQVMAQKSMTVTVIHPSISLTKTASSKIENNTSVTYTFNVTNTGDTPLTVRLVDDKLGTQYVGTVLAAGASVVTTNSTILINTMTNTATAYGVDQNGTQVMAQKTLTVTVINPSISLTKTADSKVENGTSVTYTFNVTNTGGTPLTVRLVDDKLGTQYVGYVLGVGASRVTTNSTILTSTTTNTATAYGVDQNGTQVMAQKSMTVTVIHPAIALTKTASPTTPQIAPADFTYNYTVTNIGDCVLSNVTIYDETFNVLILGPIPTLAIGQSQWATYGPVTYPVAGNYTNYANATGADQTGAKVNAFANATVVVLPPLQTTRTWGFWKTHTNFTEYVFDANLSSIIQIDSNSIHAKTIDSYAKLFGAFESNVARDSTGAKRSAIDSARISLLHQLLAVILNKAGFGSSVPIDPVTQTNLITAANNAYSGDNATEINRVAGLLDMYNNSGDNIPFPDGTPWQGKATPLVSKDIAETGITYWDNL